MKNKRLLKLIIFYASIILVYSIIGGFLLHFYYSGPQPSLMPINIELSITFALSFFIFLILAAGTVSIFSQIIAGVLLILGNKSKKLFLVFFLNFLSIIGNIVAVFIVIYLLLTI